MKVQLASKEVNTTAYGLKFNDKGVCDVDKKTVQSLLDAGLVEEAKKQKSGE
jgi:hypothetical protein|tara:strand:- start:354 stop:509 length:156 start_codon:yes stop_codon:yes gene_type:complete